MMRSRRNESPPPTLEQSAPWLSQLESQLESQPESQLESQLEHQAVEHDGRIPFAVGHLGMGIAPLLRGLAEEGDVEQVGLAGIHGGRLRFGDRRRDEGVLYRVGVDAVIDLCEGALEIPTELEAVVFFVLEALEFLDQVELEFRAEPRAELEGDVLVGVGAAVAAGTRDETIGSGQVDPLLGREEETVPARLISNSLEFEGIKTGVVDAFPDAERGVSS